MAAPAAPLGNALEPSAYSLGRQAALDYASQHAYSLECALEVSTQWGDMDANAHINNTVPLRWCESGRGTFMRAVVRDLASPSADPGLDAQARDDLNGSGRGRGVIFGEVRYRYLRPIFHPDNLLILTHTSTISPKSLTVKTVVFSYAQRAPVGESEGTLFSFDHDLGRSAPWHAAVVEGMVRRGARKVGFDEGTKKAKL
ncbi:hypothetical protein DMC30DRAFT_264388 [Rhodotorula diobovata]|uniref:HotDog domain-containing protein n=1 Tax=Rhodotorula diobovata TaxID=5288 RepID=A0A5C5FTR8_9BASI|nr:hypothetical protein DMC30DRAFT_264388 [Rhodotorula diobovata]